MNALSFKTLRAANLKRLPLFKNAKGEPAHSQPDGSDWDLSQWFEALDGETGEYANFHKKFVRGDLDESVYKEHAANELADIATYLDLCAYRMGIEICGPTLTENFAQVRETNVMVLKDMDAAGEKVVLNLAKAYMEMKSQIMLAYIGYEQARTHVSAFHIYNALIYIDVIAMHQGIDLGHAIVTKFNFVSNRVGCNVIITDNDEVGTIVNSN